MRYITLALVTAMATIGAILLSMLGMDYIDPDIGYGLHPAIAFPLATMLVCLVGVLILLITSSEDEPEDKSNDDDLMVKHY